MARQRSVLADLSGYTPEELAYRLRQQALLAEFGRCAIRCRDFGQLLHQAAELCADGMQTRFAKVLHYRPAENRLLVVAGVGWADGVVGQATVGADLESPAGYAVKTGIPVISNHLTNESRFRTPQLLAEHGVTRAINVVIRSEQAGDPFGVLEVDSSDRGRFDEADLAFMQGFANLLAVAIERQNAEAALAEREEQMRLIIEGAADYAIFTTDSSGVVTSWCPGAQAIFGWTEAELVGKPADLLFTPEDRAAGVPATELGIARSQGCADDERWHIRKDGTRFWASGATRLLHDAEGRERAFLKIARDATRDRLEAERLREHSERQTLLAAEISHRVKNSLALVAGLLSMQARTASTAEVRDALQDAEGRVTTIARIHDQLWRGSSVATVDMSVFLGDLCGALQQSAPGHPIVCDAAAVTMPADKAIPIGLIVNELVTNALKYAYPAGEEGAVVVRFLSGAGDCLRLEVADDGVGLPAGFEPLRDSGSLGMRVVASLVRQLRATLTAERADRPGARFVIELPC